MFFARVIVGKYKHLPSDSTIKIPPPLENDPSKKYDSVQGNTCSTDVFMVYANKKAYPEYLITY